MLEEGGQYQWRREGEYHLFNPETVYRLQHATQSGRYELFQRLHPPRRRPVRAASAPSAACSRSRPTPCTPIPIEEVEPVDAIVRRFATGAMSLGSISEEAHETLAIAMNRLGGRSNTGEGGEDSRALPARCATATRGAAPSSRSPPGGSA